MTGSALGGNMIRSRLKKMAIVAGTSAVLTAGTLALNPFSASADAATTTTTVSGPATVTTGHAATFTAVVAPSKTTTTPVVKASGAVTFTVTGSDNSNVPCSNVPALGGTGKFTCKVAAGNLLASASPYTVTASYAGDGGANFGPSSGTLSETVNSATTHIKITFDSKPSNGASTVVTATLSGGSGALPTGDVTFSVDSPSATKPAMVNCGDGKTSGNFQALSSNGATKPQAVATCDLVAGWLNATATNKDPHPVSTWQVTASYDGDSNYGRVYAFKKGQIKA
jgi:hypothetical protein